MPSLALLDPILGSTSRVRILRTLVQAPSRWFTEADLARAIRMSPNTVNQALRGLRTSGLLQARMDSSSASVRWNPRSPLSSALVTLFRGEAQAFDSLARSVRPIVGRTAACVLFGSVARGEAGPESDIDLLLIVPTHSKAAELGLSLRRALRRIVPGTVHIIHYTPAELRTRWETPLVRSIREEGVTLSLRRLEEFQ